MRYKSAVHLLVVEDDPRLGRLLSRLFSNDRHVVDLATVGQDAIELLGANSGFDAVILDVGLPGIDGFEVARRIRASASAGVSAARSPKPARNSRSARSCWMRRAGPLPSLATWSI